MKPNEEFFKKKGELVTHLTTRDSITPTDNGVLFVSADEKDRMFYKSVLAARIMKHCKTKTINSIEIELKEDLKAPSREDSVKIFKEHYDNNKKEMHTYLKNRVDELMKIVEEEDDPKLTKEWTNIKNKIYEGKKSSIENYGYKLFNHAFTERGITDNKLFKDYIEDVKKRGYNALIDDNDSKYSHMGAKVPIIILDEMSVIGNMTINQIKSDTIYNDYMKWIEAEMNR